MTTETMTVIPNIEDTTSKSDPPTDQQQNKYVFQCNPYTVTAAQLGEVLNILGIVISGNMYETLDPKIKHLFMQVN